MRYQFRMKTAFALMEELNHMWGFAEDLESYEYVCKEFLGFFGGPVSCRIQFYLAKGSNGRISSPIPISKTR